VEVKEMKTAEMLFGGRAKSALLSAIYNKPRVKFARRSKARRLRETIVKTLAIASE
jgi:hypothetical protein